jgi:hypothetical protein
MDIEAIRIKRLRLVIKERFNGVASDLAGAIGRQSGYVSRVLNSKKGFGEDFARDIEAILDLGRGYLDREADEATALSADDQRFIRMVTDMVLTREVPQHVRDATLTLLGSSPVKAQDGPQQMAA